MAQQSLVMDDLSMALVSPEASFFSQTILELCQLLGHCFENSTENDNVTTATDMSTDFMRFLHCFVLERPSIMEPLLMAKEMLELEDYGYLFWGLNSPSELTWPADSSRISAIVTALFARIMGVQSSSAYTNYIGGGDQASPTEHETDAPSSSNGIKTEPGDGRPELDTISLGPVSVKDQTTEQNAAHEIVPLSSFDIVKRHQDTPSSTRKSYERRNVSGSPPQRASNTGSLDVNNVPSSILRQSSRIKEGMTPKPKLNSLEAKNTRPSVLRQSSRLKKIVRPRSSKTAKRTKSAIKNTLKPTLGTTPAPIMSQTQRPAEAKVTFHFFLMNENFGVFPVALKDCNTFDLFFEEAEKAWKFQGGNGGKNSMVAVMLEHVGCAYPMNVRWKDVQMYERMMEWVEIGEAATAEAGRVGDLVVKVKRIRK